MQKILVIAGPTASGKSDVAIKLAKKLDGEIISADSMQIYKRMNIGTAKVMPSEMDGIPHHMIDIVEPNTPFNVADYAEMAREKIKEIGERGKLPILVGGTGLYVESIIYPYNFGDARTNTRIREKIYADLNKYGNIYMHNKLKEVDPEDAEKIHPNNIRRLVRALEVYEMTGGTKSAKAVKKKMVYDAEMYVLDTDRKILYDKIANRVQKMFDKGLLNEVCGLINSGLNFKMQCMQAIGYKEFEPYFNHQIDFETVKLAIVLNSKHFAKRQLTWFKRYDFAEFITPENLLKKFCIEN